jgi:hypothetical protein
MVLKMVNLGINNQFYVNPKKYAIEIVAIDLANQPKILART